MKLLYCLKCHDVFRLFRTERKCACGETSGRYIDNTYAEVTGKHAVGLAIGNGSLFSAIARMGGSDEHHDRQWYRDNCGVLCWVRPMEGPGNPHCNLRDEKAKTQPKTGENA